MRFGTTRDSGTALSATLPYALLQITTWSFYAILLSFSGNVLRDFDFSDSRISLFLGITALLSFGIQLLIGRLTARIPQLKVSSLLFLLGAFMLGGNILVRCSFLPKTVAIAAYGLTCMIVHLLPALTNGIGMDAIKRGSPTNYSLARGMGSLGYSFFAYVTGFLVRTHGSGIVPVIAGISAALLLLSTFWYYRIAVRPLPTPVRAVVSDQKATYLLRRYPDFLFFLAGNVLLQLSHSLIGNFMFQIMSAKNGTAAEQGIATAICAFVELPVMFGFPLIVRRIPCKTWVCFSGLCMLAKPLFIFCATAPAGVYAAQASQMLGYGLFTISSVNYIELLVEKGESVQAQNYLGASITAGSLLALFSGGYLCQYFGVPILALVSCCCALSGGVIVWHSAKHTSKGIIKPPVS